MDPQHRDVPATASAAVRGGGWRELALVVLGYAALTVFLIHPLALHIGSVGRLDNADTRMIMWNVAWVARTLVVDPLHLFDANVFHPHRGTLAYSETNLGAGIVAIPVYWATRNPYAAHNFAVLLSFVLSGTCTYYLVRYLTGDRRAAAIAGVCFAFCPYIYSHLAHAHLLATFGLPLSLLAFHRLLDRPTPARGAALGLAIATQALFSGYYGVFAGLVIGYAVLAGAAIRRVWTDARYWTAVATAAGVTLVCAIPLFLPQLRLQRETGFSRPFSDAYHYSAHWRTYFASPTLAHRWMLQIIRRWNEVLFPGFVACVGGVAGLVAGWRGGSRAREVVLLYGGLAALAFWASLGPAAGLYRVFYALLPPFKIMRAPSRFGLLVALALSVLAGLAIAALLARVERARADRRRWISPRIAAGVLGAIVIFELYVPLAFTAAPPVQTGYRVLARLPRAPAIEFPFYSGRSSFWHTQYMLNSTAHWMPIVNGYSSYTPRDFVENTPVLTGFPSREAFQVLERYRVRYVIFHMDAYEPAARQDLAARLAAFNRYLKRWYADDRFWLYEIVEFPY